MSDLNEETIRTLSRLCRIEIEEEEVAPLFANLKSTLDYVSQLLEVDVSHLSPHSHLEEQNVNSLREDRVGEPLDRAVFLKNAPDHVGGMIRVPPVMKQPQ